MKVGDTVRYSDEFLAKLRDMTKSIWFVEQAANLRGIVETLSPEIRIAWMNGETHSVENGDVVSV